ncbi:hypothetical protein QBC43DRAFT_327988, partial [Cladorrhinum sp. PSN259]
HINDSIQAINSTSWLIGEKLLLSRAFFVLSDTPSPLPQHQPHPADSTDSELPRVYAARDHRYYIIVSRIPGQTLTEAWPTIDKELRQVDGGQLTELYLSKGKTLDPEILQENCVRIGMDVSSLVFYHCDLGPGNILIKPDNNRRIGIIDWETAGYVPREWVWTKFHLSSGMDFPDMEDIHKSDWRRLVSRKLAAMGFEEVINGWLALPSA